MYEISQLIEDIGVKIDSLKFGVEIETGIDFDDVCEEYEEEYYDDYEEEWVTETEMDYTQFAHDIANVLKIYVDNIYEDGSCGTEIPTSTYHSVRAFRDDLLKLKELFESYDYDYEDALSPKHGAGGHFNVSFKRFHKNTGFVVKAIRPFVPLLVYMFGHPDTAERNPRYRYMRLDISSDIDEYDEKYHWLHLKSYALEFRFPDSPARINYSSVLYYTIIGLAIVAASGKENDVANEASIIEELDSKIYKTYRKELEYDQYMPDDKLMYNLFQAMLEYLEEYMWILKNMFGIDLEGMLHFCFEYPSLMNDIDDVPDVVFRYYMGDYHYVSAGIEYWFGKKEIVCMEVF